MKNKTERHISVFQSVQNEHEKKEILVYAFSY